jgi:hypothetical protein
MVIEAINATGWTELLNGQLVMAAFSVYNASAILNGWTIGILFFVYQFILIVKTKSVTLAFTMGLIFASLFVGVFLTTTSPLLAPHSVKFIFLILVFELAGILYYAIWR